MSNPLRIHQYPPVTSGTSAIAVLNDFGGAALDWTTVTAIASAATEVRRPPATISFPMQGPRSANPRTSAAAPSPSETRGKKVGSHHMARHEDRVDVWQQTKRQEERPERQTSKFLATTLAEIRPRASTSAHPGTYQTGQHPNWTSWALASPPSLVAINGVNPGSPVAGGKVGRRILPETVRPRGSVVPVAFHHRAPSKG